jgi:hypothetical protein
MKHPLEPYRIRTGVLRDASNAYVLAFDPRQEADEEYFTYVFKWTAGTFSGGAKNFNAHTCCVVTVPTLALVLVAGDGYYGFVSASAQATGNIFEQGLPAPTQPRYGDMRWVEQVEGKAYAVGHMGTVYRLDDMKRWTRIDEALPRTFHIEAIHGFDAAELYTVGKVGQLWQNARGTWLSRELPTNVNLTRVKCAGDGRVYVAGHRGVLLRGRNDAWSIIDHHATTDDIWALEWFDGSLYVATAAALFRLEGDVLTPVDFGADVPGTFYSLTAADGVMWSLGEQDIMAFDGKRWTRIL